MTLSSAWASCTTPLTPLVCSRRYTIALDLEESSSWTAKAFHTTAKRIAVEPPILSLFSHTPLTVDECPIPCSPFYLLPKFILTLSVEDSPPYSPGNAAGISSFLVPTEIPPYTHFLSPLQKDPKGTNFPVALFPKKRYANMKGVYFLVCLP